MDRWERPPATRHRRNNPSFSSSLLDAIYRSIDESDSAVTTGGGNPTAGAGEPAPRHKTRLAAESPLVSQPRYRVAYSSSSDFSGFSSSSSDPESARITRPKPVRTGPVLTLSERIRSDQEPTQQKPKKISISIKKKLGDLKNSTSPSSPGAKLAGFLNSLFTASSHKKPKISTAEEPSPSPSPSNCSSASSYSRSCLSKTPSTRGSGGSRRSGRSVRFCPVGVIVDEDCRPCGKKLLFDSEIAAAAEAEAEAERGRERRRRMIEELMKGFEMEDDEEEEESDGSDDLFELENLAGIDGRFTDELPVYETTDLGMNCAIAEGLVM